MDVPADPAVLRLRKLDACAVSDALDKLRWPGAATGPQHRSGPARVAGRAVTMKVGLGEQNVSLSYPAHNQEKGVQSAEIPDCGNYPMYSNPPEIWKAIADFIGKRS